jgi:hypothetical protein
MSSHEMEGDKYAIDGMPVRADEIEVQQPVTISDRLVLGRLNYTALSTMSSSRVPVFTAWPSFTRFFGIHLSAR